MRIDPKKIYSTNDILEAGLMWQGSRDTQQQMLLRFIRDGRLVAKNVGTHMRARYEVLGTDLITFIKKYGAN